MTELKAKMNIQNSGGVLADLVQQIRDVNPLQGKQLRHIYDELKPEEIAASEELIDFYREQGDSLAVQAASYLHFVEDTVAETKYFFEHDDYRYHSFAEVARQVYFDQDYMHDYMQGLGLSQFLWPQHLGCLRFFREICAALPRVGRYLEIGPGHGQYLREAVRLGVAESYTALDVSETSLEFTKRLLTRFMPDEAERISYICRDVNEMAGTGQYDRIVMCEVLEHVEQPLNLLKSLRRMLAPGGRAFVSVPVNAPVVDHIFLFRTVEEVTTMAEQAGFRILEQRAFCTRNRTLAKAMKMKDAVLAAMLLG